MAVILVNPAYPPSPGDDASPYVAATVTSVPDPTPGVGDLVAQANLWVNTALQYPYEFYEVRTFYEWDRGVVKMPAAAADGTQAAIVKVSAAHGRKVVAYAAHRNVAKPELPRAETDSANQVLKFEWHHNRHALLGDDGWVPSYWFGGYYVYELLVPLSPNRTGDQLNFAQPPTWAKGDGSDVTTNRLTPSDFVGGITAE